MNQRLRKLTDALVWCARAALLSRVAEWAMPTPSTVFFNHVEMPPASPSPPLPNTDWSRRERHLQLARSEERLRTIETKGPGLVTVTAVIAGAAVLALDAGWDTSTWVGRALLVGAAFYAVASLCMPLYLVGPQRRHTIDDRELLAAADSPDPEEHLAADAAEAAAQNNRRNIMLTNLQSAARKETVYALALVVIWALLAPATGVVQRRSESVSRPVAVGPPPWELRDRPQLGMPPR
jgi:hypothetical protein